MNEPVYRVALPFKMGTWVKDAYTGYAGSVTGYYVHSDLSVSVTVSRASDSGDLKSTEFLASRVSPCDRVIE